MDYSTLQMPVAQNPDYSSPEPLQQSPRNSQSSRRPPSSGRERDHQPPQRRSSGNTPMSSIEKTVTTLLVATKSLLESLTAWSQGRMTEQQVSDVYVQLTSDFHKACQSFSKQGINVSDLSHIPPDLRACLEKALSEEASPASLELYLPKIRDVIVTLLQGLKAKQAMYRQIHNSDETPQLHRQMSVGSASQPPTSDNLSASSLRRNVSAPPAPSVPTVLKTNNSVRTGNPLDTLKQSNALERRASKRYSAYTHKSNRELSRRPSLLSDPQDNFLHPSMTPPRQSSPTSDSTNQDDDIPLSETTTETELPNNSFQEPVLITSTERIDEVVPIKVENPPEEKILTLDIQDKPEKKSLTLFLQVGKDVKKTSYDGDVSISALRMLFIEKFSYNPGLDDFPNIYIKDSSNSVFYELEDLSEVRNNSVLALNVEALEQVKKHIDQSIAALTKEIREIKKSFSENNELLRRGNTGTPNASTSSRPAPSEMQLRELAKKVLANFKQKNQNESKPDNKNNQCEKIVNDIKIQFDEVQNLRRDLGIMRQLYSEFQDETQHLIQSLTDKTTAVKQVAMTNVGSARAFINAGKMKLDAGSQQLLTRVDELQDIIDELKADVTQRKCKPRPSAVDHVKKESDAVEKELASLSNYVKTVKPQWKKTWEEELQTIVEEQRFLNHQEELLEDMQDDHHKLTEVFSNILKVVEIKSKSRPKEFRVVPTEEGFEGLVTVLQEVRGIAPDSQRRLRAVQQAEKMRERELANRIDEFEQELTQFVSENKLKKTGGAQEVERLRQKKDEDALKELFKTATTE
ncbi:hypothetical protein G9A89_021530 [Geosiphon pyriformis]|nr:hypothetical protein G9A89_021530 [Geosiphon pyriformis]